jgi:hypothetical protein
MVDEIGLITHLVQAGAVGVLVWQMLIAQKREERMAADIRRLEDALIDIKAQLEIED